MVYRHTIDQTSYVFASLRDLLAKATPPRSGDRLAGIAADSAEEMVAARMALADLPLTEFLQQAVVPYEDDEVTRLILDGHDAAVFDFALEESGVVLLDSVLNGVMLRVVGLHEHFAGQVAAAGAARDLRQQLKCAFGSVEIRKAQLRVGGNDAHKRDALKIVALDRKSTRLNSSHEIPSRMPSSA